jgi:hypothetical protein
MSRGETPAQGVEELAIQASTLRQKEAESVAGAIDTSVDDALVFLEDDEATNMDANISMGENYLGMLAAPVQIAAHHLVKGVVDKDQVDNFVDPAIIAGIINTAGAKINSADLKRAANNKPAGLLGALGQGGTKAYDALRKYLNDPTNADEKKAVLSGVITDVSQLRMFNTDQVPNTGGGSGLKLLGKDLVDEVAKQKKKEVIQKYLPIIIIGLVALIIIVVLIARKK